MVTLNDQPREKKVYSLVVSSLDRSDVEACLQAIYDQMSFMVSPENFDIEIYETRKINQI